MLNQMRHVFVVRRCFVRFISEQPTSTGCNSLPMPETRDLFRTLENGEVFDNRPYKRSLKVAILGAPNAGKSTLINRIVGHPVFSVSKKVHTTRKRARAAVVRDNTQVLFVDTPGLVSAAEVKRHHLESSFVEDGLRAVNEANLVGIVHDVGNQWTRGRLDSKILSILKEMDAKKRAFLVINKVDMIKQKDVLLDLIGKLTEDKQSEVSPRDDIPTQGENGVFEKPVEDRRRKLITSGWPHFQEVFLVSALKGDGVKDILNYLLQEAEEGKWPLPPGRLTDQKSHHILEELVRGRLLDALPQEVPYNLAVETEYFHRNDLAFPVATHFDVLAMLPSNIVVVTIE